jgi:hypothetical protein
MSMGWMAILLVFQAPPASADIAGLQVVKVNVPARAIEAPVLRNRLLPSLEEISTGNAAVHFATAPGQPGSRKRDVYTSPTHRPDKCSMRGGGDGARPEGRNRTRIRLS